MRARYLIRDMANGSVDAWQRAELKLSQSDIRPANRKALDGAMATLPDPRRPDAIKREPADGRRYAITVHASEDWSDNPAIVDTEYIYENRTDATVEAYREMWRQYCLGSPANHIGAYVISDDATDTDDPSVETLLTLPGV